jgi:predicted permease
MRRVFRLPLGRTPNARDVDDELAFHIETRVGRLVASGMTEKDARAEALRQFGNVAATRDDCVTLDEQRERAMTRGDMIHELRQNTVFAVRTLRRNFGVTLVIVLALAIGIGANTAIFTLIDAVLVRALPVSHPEQLVAVGDPTRVGGLSQGTPRTDVLSYDVYKDLRDHNRSFSGILASARTGRLNVYIDGQSGDVEHPRARFVSGNYFSVLGVRPAAGRTLNDADDGSGTASQVATISHGYWTRRFHDDPSVIGRSIVVQGIRITIVGVSAASFSGEIVGTNTDIWLPIGLNDILHPNRPILADRATNWILALGRLKPGVTLEQARQDVTRTIRESILANSPGRIGAEFTASKPKYYVSDGSKGFSRVRQQFQAPLTTLMIGVMLLLCIICANVANLLLARSIARGREMAVRLALGADRRRIVRQLLTESAVLALAGAAAGTVLAIWGSRGLLVLSGAASTSIDLGIDIRVLSFTLGLLVLSVLLFGLAPALRASRVDLASTMRAGSQAVAGNALGLRGQRAPLGKLLIVGQVALSAVLLVGAAMLVRSLRNIQTTDVGLDRDHLVIVDLDIAARGYSGAALANLVHSLSDRIRSIPGVAAAGYSENGIFSGTESGMSVELPGFTFRAPGDSDVAYDQASPGYANAIGARLIEGRDLVASDEGKLARVAIVNQSLANFYFPHGSAVGQYLHTQDSIAVQIVGVIGDTRDHALLGDPLRRMYFPYAHHDAAIGPPQTLSLEVRTTGDPTDLVQQIRKTVTATDANLPIDNIDALTALMSESISQQRLLAQLATAFGILALVLAAIGLYGVMTYAITRRTGEIGLRVALGARQADVIRLVLFDALRLVAGGLVIGVPLALASTRFLRAQLHGVGTIDPASVAVAIGVLAISGVVAVTLPALRASRVSPIVALKAE